MNLYQGRYLKKIKKIELWFLVTARLLVAICLYFKVNPLNRFIVMLWTKFRTEGRTDDERTDRQTVTFTISPPIFFPRWIINCRLIQSEYNLTLLRLAASWDICHYVWNSYFCPEGYFRTIKYQIHTYFSFKCNIL